MRRSPLRAFVACLVFAGASAGCRQDMHDQPRIEPYEETEFFADGLGNRAPLEGTVARGMLRDDEAFFTGLAGDQFLDTLPMERTRRLLERGRERYDIYCSPCHSRVGDGRGMIVRRGFKQPSSFHDERLRNQKIGYFFDVITRGFGEMSSYVALIEPEDRWAIAAYIRALQLSQNVSVEGLEPADRKRVEHAIATQDHPPAPGDEQVSGHPRQGSQDNHE